MSYYEIATGVIDRVQNQFQGNDSGNAPVLMMLGSFKFSLNTAVFQEVRYLSSWRWEAQERMQQLDALQYTGPGEDTITFSGVVYPDFKGGTGQIANLRALASDAKPQRLISGSGHIMGYWVIESVEEVASVFKTDATPRKQEFSMRIRLWGGND